MQNSYRKSKHSGIKAWVGGKWVCRECGMEIEAEQPSPYCYFCEVSVVKMIKDLYTTGWSVGLLSQKFKMGYIKIRDILGLKKGEGCAKKSPSRITPVNIGKNYSEYVKERVVPVRDSLSFLKSKIRT